MMNQVLGKLRRAAVGLMVAALVGSSVVTASAPALADASYSPTSPLAALFPDVCIPSLSGVGCMTWTHSSAMNSTATVLNQIQAGLMVVQDLRSGPLGSLKLLGVTDPSETGLINLALNQITKGLTKSRDLACSTSVSGAAASNSADLASLMSIQRSFGVGNTSVGQIESTVMSKVAGAMEMHNQCQAAQAVAQRAQVQAAYESFGSMFDLDGDVTAGWNF